MRRGAGYPITLSNRLAALAVVLCLELVAIAVTYQVLTPMECRMTGSEETCVLLRSLVARALSVLAAFALVAWARPLALRELAYRIEANTDSRAWLLLHLTGLACMFAPLAMAGGGNLSTVFRAALAPWLVGASAASVGALFWLAPPGAWFAWLRQDRGTPIGLLAVAFLIPDLAEGLQPLWDWSALTRWTFVAVHLVLAAFGAAPVSSPDSYIIGVEGFFVEIARACSGVEGLALVTAFVLLYAVLFREETRLRRYWFVVLPLGIALSWMLNVLRIAALIALGAHVSPELAVNGFHSYAGWMFFTLLALGLLYGVQATPWLQKGGRRAAANPWRDDWTAACILPFAAFMLAGLAVSALAPEPELAYWVKILAALVALAVFRRGYRNVGLRPDGVAVGAGIAVGLAWIATRPAVGAADLALGAALAQLGGLAFALFATARVLGTVLVVPLVEELFFRGYILARLDRGGLAARLLAIVVSSALFGLLHQRWLAGAVAGVVFALLMLRRGRMADAVVAHVAANLVVAGWAIAARDWGAI